MMTSEPDEGRIHSRAHLSPEEAAAGSDDSHRQAEVILQDSDERTEHPAETQHESSQTPDERLKDPAETRRESSQPLD